ncbi:hypothetical protein LSH36_12g19040 [Paralvinella palmiformis]|uniref:Uncharacterized protein n=1 Tax=Paralvinella palmiformis TaxID=53620 RepID=A0AAD9KD67_9ANNE|nr:hypothetical protein LSH36_12g19040 [Paralvinella palmiformis]
MSLSTNWYYKPTNSTQYPSIPTRFEVHTRPRTMASDSLILSARKPPVNKAVLDRLSRPTLSSRQRFENPRLSFSHTNRYISVDGHYVWSKMAFFEDCYRCMYNPQGSMKSSKKL